MAWGGQKEMRRRSRQASAGQENDATCRCMGQKVRAYPQFPSLPPSLPPSFLRHRKEAESLALAMNATTYWGTSALWGVFKRFEGKWKRSNKTTKKETRFGNTSSLLCSKEVLFLGIVWTCPLIQSSFYLFYLHVG